MAAVPISGRALVLNADSNRSVRDPAGLRRDRHDPTIASDVPAAHDFALVRVFAPSLARGPFLAVHYVSENRRASDPPCGSKDLSGASYPLPPSCIQRPAPCNPGSARKLG